MGPRQTPSTGLRHPSVPESDARSVGPRVPTNPRQRAEVSWGWGGGGREWVLESP